jgi:hypothetical protein
MAPYKIVCRDDETKNEKLFSGFVQFQVQKKRKSLKTLFCTAELISFVKKGKMPDSSMKYSTT